MSLIDYCKRMTQRIGLSYVLIILSLLLSIIGMSTIANAQTAPPSLCAEGISAEDCAALYGDWVEYDTTPSTCAGGSGQIPAPGDVPVDFSLGTDGAERRVNLIKAFMAAYALTPEQASGPVGNFMHESGSKELPPNVNEGGSAGPPHFSGGYGWAQWTGSRQVTFIDYAIENGYMASKEVDANDGANLAYLEEELNTGYTETITELKKQSTPEDAAVSFEATFEKAGVPALEPRKANARQAYEEYMASDGSGVVGSGGCGAAGDATIVGDTAFPLIATKTYMDEKNPGLFKDGTTGQAGHPYIAYDILADTDTEIVAFISGTVTHIGTDRCPGRLVGIYNAENDRVISYLHMRMSDHVAEGETVTPGQHVGFVGTLQNGCTIPHLHIDAAAGDSRPGCSRLDCPEENQAFFRDIGPDLFKTYEALPQ